MIVEGLNEMTDGDLASMENVSKYNNCIKYLRILIDVFSGFLTVRPLIDKNSKTVAKALESIFSKSDRRPKIIRFDQGGEFKGAVKTYLREQGIHVFYTQNSQMKSNYAERVIKILKSKIYHYFMENDTYKYIDVLQKLVSSYNRSPNESLGNVTPESGTVLIISTFHN